MIKMKMDKRYVILIAHMATTFAMFAIFAFFSFLLSKISESYAYGEIGFNFLLMIWLIAVINVCFHAVCDLRNLSELRKLKKTERVLDAIRKQEEQ